MAHATHPNYADRHDPEHRVALNGGPVLKVNANVRYATDAPGAALVALAAEQAGVPLQRFAMRSDLPCGSTIGPITAARLGITTVDVGMPQLAMHAAREYAGQPRPGPLPGADGRLPRPGLIPSHTRHAAVRDERPLDRLDATGEATEPKT